MIINEITHLERYYEAKVQASSSRSRHSEPAVRFGTQSVARATLVDYDSEHSAARTTDVWAQHWVPPASVHEEYCSRTYRIIYIRFSCEFGLSTEKI